MPKMRNTKAGHELAPCCKLTIGKMFAESPDQKIKRRAEVACMSNRHEIWLDDGRTWHKSEPMSYYWGNRNA